MSFTEDLSPFFADHGVNATVGAVTCLGIFDNIFLETMGFTAGSRPTLLVKSADVPAVAENTAVSVPAGSYTVTTIEPDGTGLTLLRLQEA